MTHKRRRSQDVAQSHYATLGMGGDVASPNDAPENRQEPASQASGAQSYQSLTTHSRQHIYRGRNPRRRRSRGILPLFLVALVLAGIAGGALFWWRNRLVAVRVNGQDTRVRIGASIEEVRRTCQLEPKPGNYVSVQGNTITEGAGWPYAAEVDGRDLHGKGFDDYRIQGGEIIVISDGADKCEPYDVVEKKSKPKLRFEGSEGSLSYVSQWGETGIREIRTGRDSGEVDKSHWAKERKDCIVTTLNPRPTDRRLVALTFDDGPSEYTQQYLDILASRGVHATFFALSENIELYPETAQAIVASGHQLASHSRTHPQMTSLDANALRDELTSSFATIAEIAGKPTTVLRPPYGDFDQSCWLRSKGLMSVSVTWDHDSEDWKDEGSDAIVRKSVGNMVSGSIILMHDGGGPREQGLNALPQVIDRWQGEGYTFVTISELLEAAGAPADIVSGNATMPEGCRWPSKIAE